MFELHPDAKTRFDSRGGEFLCLVKEARPEHPRKGFSPDVHIKHHITDEDVIDFKPGAVTNGFGEELGFFFIHDKKRYGIFDEHFKELLKLAESIGKLPAFRDKVSISTLKQLLYEWISKTCSGSINTGLIDFIIENAAELITMQHVWVPIRFLHIQKPFIIGRIAFKPISKVFIDELEASWVENSPDNFDKIKDLFDKQVREFQGHTGATISIEADPAKAEEVALEETKKSLMMLRLLSGAAFHPRIVSLFEIWGSEKIEAVNLLFLKDGKLSNFTSKMLLINPPHMELDQEAIDLHFESGLNVLSDLLIKDNKSQFEKVALDAFFIYSRCTTSKDPADKLLYILVALESLFLKNNTEPIQQNLAERVAFLIEKSIDGRRQVIKDVRNAYSIRSSFVHHGASIEDFEALEKFMWHAWRAITVVITATKSVVSKDEFLDHLDSIKLS